MNPDTVAKLRDILENYENDPELKRIIDAKDEVIRRYQQIFTPGVLDEISAEQFRSFLRFENNCHWTGLSRKGNSTTQDMKKLHKALCILLDESESATIEERLDKLFPGGEANVPNLGKAILTAILTIVYPDRYGVWNGISEEAAKRLEIWPNFDRGLSWGNRYKKFNEYLIRISKELNTDLWTLDALWWGLRQPVDKSDGQKNENKEEPSEETEKHFGLERHLHNFLFDNWEKTELGETWDLYEEGGDIQGYGYERPTDVGRIDLLAKHKTEPRWLVIELKRGQTSDDTVGQVLRYMGWINEKLAKNDEQVEGLIIARDEDEKLRYALTMTQNVRFYRYKVNFELKDASSA